MDERTKMHSTELYNPNDPTIADEQQQCLELLYDYNATRPHESEKRQALLKKMFAEIGDAPCKLGGKFCSSRKIGVCQFQSHTGG